MNFIKKIAEKRVDPLVHIQFQKFGRGVFKNRALINAKESKGSYTINTGPEFVNEIVMMFAEKLGDKKTNVTGAIISTSDLREKIEFKEIKQFQGVKKYLINTELSGSEIISLIEKFPKVFFALTFNVDENNTLKTKPKAPKSGKSGKGDEEPKADFCRLKTNDPLIGGGFVFEKKDFKKADIKHDFVIEKIIMPDTDEKNFAKIREMAKREGKVLRYSIIDGVKRTEEFWFET